MGWALGECTSRQRTQPARNSGAQVDGVSAGCPQLRRAADGFSAGCRLSLSG